MTEEAKTPSAGDWGPVVFIDGPRKGQRGLYDDDCYEPSVCHSCKSWSDDKCADGLDLVEPPNHCSLHEWLPPSDRGERDDDDEEDEGNPDWYFAIVYPEATPGDYELHPYSHLRIATEDETKGMDEPIALMLGPELMMKA
jgi:hypothetical protein